jgi:membrane-associated phospholipid phosphatase
MSTREGSSIPLGSRRPAVSVSGLRLSHGLREVTVVVVIYLAYTGVRSLSNGMGDVALAHAEQIIRWQREWGLYWEPDIQAWALDHLAVMHIANAVYFWFHLPLLIVFAVWMFVANRGNYSFLRNVWVFAQTRGLIVFLLYPVAPPRLLPGDYGFVDMMALHSPVNYSSAEASPLVNQYAAFPSLHFAWSFIIAVGLYWTLPWGWARGLAVLFPLASFWSIVATGNHFVADAVGGALVAALAFLLALTLDRAWRWWLSHRLARLSRHPR